MLIVAPDMTVVHPNKPKHSISGVARIKNIMASRPIQPETTDWRFTLQWSAAGLVGIALGMGSMVAGVGAAINHAPPLVFGAIFGTVLGTASGIAQWAVLRRRLSHIGWWIPATLLGWGLFWSFNILGLFGHGSGVISKLVEGGLIHGPIFGVVVGGLQWLVLRRRVDRAGWWVAVNVGGWALSAALADSMKAALGVEAPLEFVIALPIFTFISGWAMNRLLRTTTIHLHDGPVAAASPNAS